MVVYGEDGSKVESVDSSKGYVEAKVKAVTHAYKVDVERESHFEVIAEYPETGGKDVKEVIDVEEQGHWETTDAETGEVVTDYDGIIPDNWPHELKFQEVWQYGVYHVYTDDELVKIEQEHNDASIAQIKAELAATDYVVIKMSEAQITGIELPEEDAKRYSEIIEQRSEWRKLINELSS